VLSNMLKFCNRKRTR